jgi:hypothetical protein
MKASAAAAGSDGQRHAGGDVECSSMPEVAGDAAVLVNPYEPEAIADGIAPC